MKLHNKRTGKIVKLEKILFKNAQTEDLLKWNTYEPNVNSLAELNEEWEDYKPTEPLIKDEKIRKAVKAMADITGVSMLYYEYYEWSKTVQLSDMNGQTLTFKSKRLSVKALESYTITELCGDEEE